MFSIGDVFPVASELVR